MATTPIADRSNARRLTPSTSKDTPCLISIIENRAREVGLACINMKSFEITLTQYVDNTNYMHTLSVIYAWDPIEIIMCQTAEESPLKFRISSHLSGFSLTFIPRKAFDEVKGEELCMNSVNKIHEQDFEKKYVCMAALAGLIFNIESTQNTTIYKDGLKINLIYLKNFLIIDFSSARMLELVQSSQGQRKDSLAGLFDCKTPAGNRMLRTSILQPSRETHAICNKLDSVHELINNTAARLELKSCLASFVNTELVTSRLIQKPKLTNEKYMKSQICNIINIFTNLELAKNLLNILVKYDFVGITLKNLVALLDDRRIDSLHEEISQILADSLLGSKCKKVSMFDCLLLVKENINPLLDIARQVYNNCMEEIHRLESQYKYRLGDPTLCITNTSSRGFHLQFDPSVLHRNYSTHLGELLLQITHKGKRAFASTASLISLNDKIKTMQTEIITLSFTLIENICSKAREKILCLYNISHTVASLDVILAFANFSITYEGTRPTFQPGVIFLQEARNPLLLQSKNLVPSHIKLSHTCGLQILTGSNSSGKTMYLKNIALQSILSHAGCFLPAKEAILSPNDYILTRIGEKESIEQNSSSFMAEMRDCSYILNTATAQSLVLIDELGKSTAHEDGVSIAWAICEKLAYIRCFTIIATHYHQLSCLEKFYPGVSNMHMEEFQVSLGTAIEEYGYGINLAARSALPSSIVANAKRFSAKISEKFGYLVSKDGIQAELQRNVRSAIENLINLRRNGANTEELVEALLKIKSSGIGNKCVY